MPGKSIGHLTDGTSFVMHATICASGVEYSRLNLWNEERLRGAGVFYGAGTSEAELCSSQEVFAVGGGNSAGQAAIHFSRYARELCQDMAARSRTRRSGNQLSRNVRRRRCSPWVCQAMCLGCWARPLAVTVVHRHLASP